MGTGGLRNQLLLDTEIQEKVKYLKMLDSEKHSRRATDQLWSLLDNFLPSESPDIIDIKKSFIDNPFGFLEDSGFTGAKRQSLLSALKCLSLTILKKESGSMVNEGYLNKLQNCISYEDSRLHISLPEFQKTLSIGFFILSQSDYTEQFEEIIHSLKDYLVCSLYDAEIVLGKLLIDLVNQDSLDIYLSCSPQDKSVPRVSIRKNGHLYAFIRDTTTNGIHYRKKLLIS